MKKRLLTSIGYIVAGLLAASGGKIIFPVCSGEMKMSCNYTSDAELGIGIAIAVLGIFFLFFAKKEIRLGIDVSQALNGLLVIMFPTCLTGVCESSEMVCHMATLPFWVLIGILLTALSVFDYIFFFGRERKNRVWREN